MSNRRRPQLKQEVNIKISLYDFLYRFDEAGLTLIGKRLMGDFPMIPIIGVSGYKPKHPTFSNSALQLAKGMGIDLAIYQPIRPDILLNAVNKLLNQGQDSE